MFYKKILVCFCVISLFVFSLALALESSPVVVFLMEKNQPNNQSHYDEIEDAIDVKATPNAVRVTLFGTLEKLAASRLLQENHLPPKMNDHSVLTANERYVRDLLTELIKNYRNSRQTHQSEAKVIASLLLGFWLKLDEIQIKILEEQLELKADSFTFKDEKLTIPLIYRYLLF